MDTMTVAGYIAGRVGDVTHEERLRLQKVLYYAEGWSLAWTGARLLDDDFEAWREGPVVRRVYETAVRRITRLPQRQQMIVDAVLRFYGGMSAQELSERTHQEQPWLDARDGLPAEASSDRRISSRTMRKYFVDQALRGAAGPRRPKDTAATIRSADAKSISERANTRWGEALDDLADR